MPCLIVEKPFVTWIEANGFIKVFDRSIEILHLEPVLSAVAEWSREFVIVPDRLFKVAHSLIRFPLDLPRDPPVVERTGVPRIEADGLVEVLDRQVVILFSKPIVPPKLERSGELGVETNGLIKLLTAASRSSALRSADPRSTYPWAVLGSSARIPEIGRAKRTAMAVNVIRMARVPATMVIGVDSHPQDSVRGDRIVRLTASGKAIPAVEGFVPATSFAKNPTALILFAVMARILNSFTSTPLPHATLCRYYSFGLRRIESRLPLL